MIGVSTSVKKLKVYDDDFDANYPSFPSTIRLKYAFPVLADAAKEKIGPEKQMRKKVSL